MDSSLACLLFSLFLLPCSLLAQNTGHIVVGSSLTAGDNKARPWLSPSEDFAFGFHQLDKKELYWLAIWYNKIPTETIIWYANGDDPAPPRSKLELTADRGLVLTSPQGAEIWKSGINFGEASKGFMNDTGNFIVSNSRSEILWQSFDHPTDTLLPGQTLERGGQILSSRLTETNFSRGRFQFRLIPDGNAVLNTNNLPTGYAYEAYFRSNTADSNLSNAGLRVVFNASGYLYVLRASGKQELLSPGRLVSAEENYYRVTLNFDGVFIQYSHPKDSTGNEGNWSVIRTMPGNICTDINGKVGTGPCGFNGVCRLGADQRPICSCPERFSLVNPNDAYGGCRPDFYAQFCEELDVSNSREDFDFLELDDTDWTTSEYEWYEPFNVEECQNACSEDCFCNVVVFKDGNCWKKKLPLTNGRRHEDFNGKTFIKVRKGNYTIRGPALLPSPTPNEKKNNDSLVLMLSVLLGGVVLVTLLSGFYYFFIYHKKSKRATQATEIAAESNLRCFSYKELFIATNGFKEMAGRGSFGIVYKGVIEMDTKVSVAVKKLNTIVEDGEKEFRTEVKVIGQTHHKNLVRLVGFCDEGQHRLLVYEFLNNGALANFLFTKATLNWNQRIQIAFGIARGLVYLHEDCSTQIIHCDIKPQNILLDDYYNAKIADFGLAKLLVLDQSQTFTAIRGTRGYVAPEWFRNMPVTVKANVYSFGVLLLEIINGRKCVDTEVSEERAILVDWAYDCYQEGRISALVEDDEEAMNDMKKFERFVMVAIWCIQEDPALRPTMKMVVLMLEGIVQVTAPPCPCPFSSVVS